MSYIRIHHEQFGNFGHEDIGSKQRLTGADPNTGDISGHRRRSVPSGTGLGNFARNQYEWNESPKTLVTQAKDSHEKEREVLNHSVASLIERKLFGREGFPGYDMRGVSVHYNMQVQHPRDSAWSIPRLRMGAVKDLKTAKSVYFNEQGIQYEITDLEEFILTSYGVRRTPVYFISDHHHAFFAGLEANHAGRINAGAAFIHIDRHSDSTRPENVNVDFNNLSDVHRYTTEVLRIDRFIAPLQESGLIRNFTWVFPLIEGDSETQNPSTDLFIGYRKMGLENPYLQNIQSGTLNPQDVWIDIDLDFFARHLELVQEIRGSGRKLEEVIQADIEQIRGLVQQAGLITVATTPDFIDQKYAIELAKRIFTS